MKTILVVRHAKAQEKNIKVKDADRVLTPAGVKQFKKVCKENKKLLSQTELFVTSPFERARETLEIVFEGLKLEAATLTIFQKLTPHDDPKVLLKWLKSRREEQILFVSHEPFISNFLKLVNGQDYKEAKIKKGSIIRVKI
jgi:phosphohistidine phosphatase